MVTEIGALIERVCAERELECEPTGDASYVVTLPGTHKLKTVCNLIVGEHALRIEAFVMRQPDESREELWAWLLQRNARMYGVAFSIDAVGDVYLTGRVALHGPGRGRAGPAARLGADLRRRVLRHDAGDRLRHVDPARVGVAGQARRVAGQPAGLRASCARTARD